MSKKSATPFHERSLLKQESTITQQCDDRLGKLPPESHLKVARDLLRAAEHRSMVSSQEKLKALASTTGGAAPAGGVGDI